MEKLDDRVRRAKAWDHLRTEGARLVPGYGCYTPKVLVVGAYPGAVDSNAGRPFSGPVGAIAMQLMELAGLFVDGPRMNAFVTNVVKYRVPGGRDLEPQEIEAGRKNLRQEWSVLGGPQVLVSLGHSAWKTIYQGPTHFVGKMRPTVVTEEGLNLFRMVDPALALRRPLLRDGVEESWEDMGRWMVLNGLLAPSS